MVTRRMVLSEMNPALYGLVSLGSGSLRQTNSRRGSVSVAFSMMCCKTRSLKPDVTWGCRSLGMSRVHSVYMCVCVCVCVYVYQNNG